jgi:predicted small metal-binding protein
MYSISCRDAGVDCDWFVRSDDIGELLVENFKHDLNVHPKDHKEMKAKYEVWQLIAGHLPYIKSVN